jgi:hypothetical protein
MPASFAASTLRGDGGQLRIRRFASPHLLYFLRPQFAFSRLAQILDLFRLKLSHLSRLKIEHERTVTHPPDLLHVVPDFLKHLAQLAVPPLCEHHFIPGVIPLPHQPDARRGRVDLT